MSFVSFLGPVLLFISDFLMYLDDVMCLVVGLFSFTVLALGGTFQCGKSCPSILGNVFFFHKFYLFIFGCVGSSLLRAGFL